MQTPIYQAWAACESNISKDCCLHSVFSSLSFTQRRGLNIIFANGFVAVILLTVALPIDSSVVHYTLLFSDILKTALNRPCFGGGAKTILFDFTSINVKTPEWSGIWSVIMIKRMINRTWRLQPGAIGTIFNGLTDA